MTIYTNREQQNKLAYEIIRLNDLIDSDTALLKRLEEA